MSVTSTNRIAVIPLHALANQLQELCWDHSVKLFDSITRQMKNPLLKVVLQIK